MIIEGILTVIGAVLAIGGLCEAIHAVRLLTIIKAHKNKMITVIPLKPDTAVFQLLFAVEQKNWLGEDFASGIVAVTDEITESELDECKPIADEYGIILCTLDGLTRGIEKAD